MSEMEAELPQEPGDAATTAPPGPFDPKLPEFQADPYRFYDWYRSHDPVHRSPTGGVGAPARWLVTSHELVLCGLGDKRLVRESPHGNARNAGDAPPFEQAIREWMLLRDPPDHTRLRRAIARCLPRSYFEAQRGRAQQFAASLVDALPENRATDLLGEFAVPLPLKVICAMMGLSPEHWRGLLPHTDGILEAVGGGGGSEAGRRASEGVTALNAIFEELIAARRAAPGEELIDALIAAEAAGAIRSEELVPNCLMLLVGGYDNATNVIANGVLNLIRYPAQREALLAAGEVPQLAIQELIRFESSVQRVSRYAAEDLELGGRAIRRGEVVTFVLGAANRDPEVFAHPNTLDLGRHNAADHCGFGSGIHSCIGVALAMVDAQVGLRTLLDTFETIELVAQEPKWRQLASFRWLEELPVILRRR